MRGRLQGFGLELGQLKGFWLGGISACELFIERLGSISAQGTSTTGWGSYVVGILRHAMVMWFGHVLGVSILEGRASSASNFLKCLRFAYGFYLASLIIFLTLILATLRDSSIVRCFVLGVI